MIFFGHVYSYLFVTLEVYISCTDNAWNVHVSSETRGRPAALSASSTAPPHPWSCSQLDNCGARPSFIAQPAAASQLLTTLTKNVTLCLRLKFYIYIFFVMRPMTKRWWQHLCDATNWCWVPVDRWLCAGTCVECGAVMATCHPYTSLRHTMMPTWANFNADAKTREMMPNNHIIFYICLDLDILFFK